MKIYIKDIYGELYDCECCGCYSASGTVISVDETTIWMDYSDGHLSGKTTETSILESFLSHYRDQEFQKIQQESTEEKRIQWNTDFPGNGIAVTPESWAKYHSGHYEYINGVIEYVKEMCANLPSNPKLQIKMICLWLQDEVDLDVEFIETKIHESEL